MEYGQAIPPKTIVDLRPQFFTKQGFAHYLARCLQTVGMIPLPTNSYDLADPANAERDPGASENARFFFDYPTPETFAPGGVSNPTAYRPCLGLTNSIYRGYTANTNVNIGGIVGHFVGWNVGFRHCRRPISTQAANSIRNWLGMYNGGAYLNNYCLQNNTDATSTYYSGEGGAVTGWSKWKLFASWGDANQQELLFVNRIFVHLGKAGLVVQVGSHTSRRAEMSNILNFAAVFAGGRIPARAYPVLQDVLRDTTDPVLFFDLGSTFSSDYSTTYPHANAATTDMTTVCLGSARLFDDALQEYNYPCNVILRSIDYLDDAVVFNAPTDVYPRPSPAIINGVGAHAIHRACMLQYRRTGSADYIGRINTSRQPNSQPLHKWEDTFYLPGFAFGDRVMTPGLKLDPNTGKNWYSIWANPRGQAFALDYDGVTETSLTSVTPPTLQETVSLDLTAAGTLNPTYTRNITRTGTLSNGIPFLAVPGTFGAGITMAVAQFEHSNIDAVMRWGKAGGTNTFLLSNWGWTSFDATKYFSLIIDLYGLVADGTYHVEFEYYCLINNNTAGDPANSNNYFELQLEGGPGSQALSTAFGNERYISARAGSPGFVNVYSNYAAYGSRDTPFPPGVTTTYRSCTALVADALGRMNLKFQMQHNYNNAAVNMTVGIRNIVLKRYA